MTVLYEDNFDELIATAWERFFSVIPGAPQYQGREEFSRAYGTVHTAGLRGEYGEAQILYNSDNNQPVEILIRPINETYSYRWEHPAFSDHRKDTIGYDNPAVPLEPIKGEEKWSDTQSIDDILDKIDVVMHGGKTDGKVVMVMDLEEDDLASIDKLAEAAGRTRDEQIEWILRKELKRLDKKAFPNGDPSKAE